MPLNGTQIRLSAGGQKHLADRLPDGQLLDALSEQADERNLKLFNFNDCNLRATIERQGTLLNPERDGRCNVLDRPARPGQEWGYPAPGIFR